MKLHHTGRSQESQKPPSYEKLAAYCAIAPEDDPYRYYKDQEIETALHLADLGFKNLLSVEEQSYKTPDAVDMVSKRTYEFKHPSLSKNSMRKRIRFGREQSRNIVLDIRGHEITIMQTKRLLAEPIRQYGGDLDSILVLCQGFEVRWPYEY